MLYCFGIFLMVLLKLVYESPRPFWTKADIHTYGDRCDFDFASPNQHMFNTTFFLFYCIFMYFQKYTAIVNKPLIYALYTFTILLTCVMAFALYLFGVMYLYQCFISILYSIMYMILCVNIDSWIQNKCEQIGFIVRSSRKYKFLLLFLCIGMFFCGYVYFEGSSEKWADQ